MKHELFGAIRDNYFTASSATMKLIGFLFGLGVILDNISIWLQSKRDHLVYAIDVSAPAHPRV
jgi:hypothetical protein